MMLIRLLVDLFVASLTEGRRERVNGFVFLLRCIVVFIVETGAFFCSFALTGTNVVIAGWVPLEMAEKLTRVPMTARVGALEVQLGGRLWSFSLVETLCK
jgi:hypothetical protein